MSLKWLLDDEDHVPQAVALRKVADAGSLRVLSPSVWIYEVVNGLVSAVRSRRIRADAADEMLVDVLDVGVELVELAPSDVLRTAMRLGVSAYDAAYVELAEQLECPCWTADRPLLRASRASPFVRSIAEFTTSA